MFTISRTFRIISKTMFPPENKIVFRGVKNILIDFISKAKEKRQFILSL